LNKPLKYTVKTLVATMAIFTLAIMLFFWRVSNGPVELDGDSPFLRNALVRLNVGENVSFEKSILTWRSGEESPTDSSSFEIRFLNIEIEDPETSTQLNIPQAGVQFSIPALFRGVVAPTFAEFSGLEINLMLPREAWSGQGFDQDAFIEAMRLYLDEFNNSPNLVSRLTKQVLSPPSALNSTGYLQQFSLSNTAINVTDEISGDVWQIPDAHLDIKRIDEGLSLLLEGAFDFENENDIPLHLSVQYNMAQEKATTQLRFSNFVPTNVAGEVEGLAALSTLNIPISGIVNFTIDGSFELPVFDFEVDFGEGVINPADLFAKPVQIDEAMLIGQFIAAEDEISIESLHLMFAGAELDGEGFISNFRDQPDVTFTAEVANMDLMDLQTYWPKDVVVGARTWIVRNLTGGRMTDGTLNFDVRPEMWALDELPAESFYFDFNIVDSSAHYIKPMPQVTDVVGKASLNFQRFLLSIESAVVEDVAVKDAELTFANIAHKGEALAHFEIPVSGKVEDMLHLMDYQPFGYPTRYGIKENSVTGDAQGHLILDFPLIKVVKISDITIDFKSDIENLTIAKLSDNFSLTEGAMNMALTDNGINATGNILLNGMDFEAQWTEDFDKTVEFPTTYIIEGDVENDEWEKLYLPFQPYVEETARANLTLYAKASKLDNGVGSFDLGANKVQFAPLGWLKEAGEQASADFTIKFAENGAFNVNDIAFKSEQLNSDLQLSYDGALTSRLYIEELTMADMDFSGLFEWDYENALYQVSIRGDRFNAVPLMDIILGPTEEGEEADLPDFNLAGSMDNVAMYNDAILHEASVLAGYLDNEVIDFGYMAKMGEDKNLSIIIASAEDLSAPQRLTLTTNDAGQSLRALDFFTSGDQGDLFIDAQMTKMEKGYSLMGIIRAEKFTVANSTAFSELLKEKEFAKAQEELEENGLSFETFESDFEQYDDVLKFMAGSAKGPTIGVTLDGYVDQKFDEVSLDGTIIPAYGLNSLLSNIPLIGTIIAGGKGEGVFAATYSMTGTVDDPVVSINPLMALAPGILRKIFGAIGDAGGDAPTAREEAEQTEEQAAVVPPPIK
jgi:hypothetical protein